MSDQVFADEIGDIVVGGAIIRFDLLINSTAKVEQGGKPELVVHQRVIMPIDAFLRAAGRIQNTVEELVKKGIIHRSSKGGSAEKT